MNPPIVGPVVEARKYSDGKRVPRLLLVEDDISVISSIQRNMRPYRIDLHVAYHGFQGVAEALSFEPDLIITDLQMPLAGGDELMQCLSHIPRTRDVPILVITGRPGVALSRKMKEMGVCLVLSKPFSFDTLLSEIAKRIPVVRHSAMKRDSVTWRVDGEQK